MSKFKKDDVVRNDGGTVLWMLSDRTFRYPAMVGWTRHEVLDLPAFESEFELLGNLNDPAYIEKLITPTPSLCIRYDFK